MPRLRATTQWRTRSGAARRIRLYRSWRRMRERVEGSRVTGNTAEPIWHGLEVEWKTFPEFRAWAIANGFGKRRCSLDRRDSTIGYTAGNCRWVTVRENSRYSYDANLLAYESEPIDGAPF